jgi:hypothetical protein
MAQLLTGFHFSALQDTQDSRFMKEVRFIRYAKNGEIEKTRLGRLGNKFANKFESKLNASGFESAYAPTSGYFDGYIIDPNNENFKDLKTKDDIKKFVKENYGLDVVEGDTISRNPELKGKLVVDTSKLGAFKMRSLTRKMLGEAGYSKISSAIGARLMCERAGCTSLLHPLKLLESKAKGALAEWWDNRKATTEEGSTPPNVSDTEKAPDDKSPTAGETTNNNKVAHDSIAGTQTEAAGATKSPGAFESFKASTTLKLAGGGAAAIGVLCMVKTVNANANDIKQAQVVLPLIRLGTEAIAVGNQVMSGQDVDMSELGKMSTMLHGKSSDGKQTSWLQAQSIQTNMGNPNSTEAPSNTLKSVGENASPFGFVDSIPVLGTVCSTGGQIATGVFGLALDLSGVGALAMQLGSGVIQSIVAGPIMDQIAHWLAGQAVDPAPVGADYGSSSDYGARLAANDQGIASGGRALSSSEEGAIKTAESTASQADFQKLSFTDKLFNPYDERSAISKLIDQQGSNPVQNIAKMGTDLLNFGHIFSSIPKLFASTAHAATPAPYDYGFPQYGFSEAELNSAVAQESPYDNAGDVAQFLDNDSQYGYIDKAKQCFGVDIAKDASGDWDVTSQQDESPKYSDIDKHGCSSSDTNWLKVRLFILDTETMTSMTCFEGDDQSCSDIGFSASSNTAPDSSSTPSPVASLTSLDGHQLSATQTKWIKYLNDNVVQLLPGNSSEQAAMAGRVTWWSLKEGVLSLDNPLNYSNCGAGGDHRIPLTATCPGNVWQVGIAGVQPPNFSLGEVEKVAKARHPGMNLKDILAEVAKSAGYSAGSTDYNTIVNSSGDLLKSLLLQDPATGFTFVDRPIQSGCINAWTNWCDVSSDFAPTQQVAKNVIAELTTYFSGATTSTNGFVFPLKTTQSVIESGQSGSVWCYQSTSSCHHDYNAADIFAPTGTPVLAPMDGVVTSAKDSSKYPSTVGSRVSIDGNDGRTYYLAHMGRDTIKVSVGQHITAGTVVGAVGTNADAENTTHHLHIDALPSSQYTTRPSCKGTACSNFPFINLQPTLISAFKNLSP